MNDRSLYTARTRARKCRLSGETAPNGITPKAGKEGVEHNQEHLRRIDLRWHDLRQPVSFLRQIVPDLSPQGPGGSKKWLLRLDSYEAGCCQVPRFSSARKHTSIEPPSSPSQERALRRQRARDAENHPIRRARWSPCVHTIESWRLRFAGALAPALLLSVAVPRTAHQRLMREAWTRAPLLELGVTSVNPSSQPGARPARGSPTGDRRVVLSALQRFQLRPDRDRPGLYVAPESN